MNHLEHFEFSLNFLIFFDIVNFHVIISYKTIYEIGQFRDVGTLGLSGIIQIN